jgi:ubiquinone/menaquinone biosynthesis C-methylase UbiE
MCQEKGLNIYSLDPDRKTIERLNNITKKAYVGYSNAIPFQEGFFDCVVMSEVIEHLSDETLDASLKEIERVLKPRGQFIGSTPANEDLLISICVCPNCGARFHKYGHMQSFTKKRIAELLKERFESVGIARKYLADPQLLNAKGKIVRFIKIALISCGIYGEGENFIWKATKRE